MLLETLDSNGTYIKGLFFFYFWVKYYTSILSLLKTLDYVWPFQRISRNCVSATHCIGVVLIIKLWGRSATYNTLVPFSVSYFLWDIACSFYWGKKQLKKDVPYIWHHFVAVWMLVTMARGRNINAGLSILWIGELSNIPGYIVYHLIHTNSDGSNNDIVKLSSLLQLIVYGYFRCFVLTKNVPLIYEEVEDDMPLGPALVSVWLMSQIWFILLLKKQLVKQKPTLDNSTVNKTHKIE